MRLDRFAYGRPDPQAAPVKATCEHCGGEIYAGQEVYVYQGLILCGLDCLTSHVLEEVQQMTIEDVILAKAVAS